MSVYIGSLASASLTFRVFILVWFAAKSKCKGNKHSCATNALRRATACASAEHAGRCERAAVWPVGKLVHSTALPSLLRDVSTTWVACSCRTPPSCKHFQTSVIDSAFQARGVRLSAPHGPTGSGLMARYLPRCRNDCRLFLSPCFTDCSASRVESTAIPDCQSAYRASFRKRSIFCAHRSSIFVRKVSD